MNLTVNMLRNVRNQKFFSRICTVKRWKGGNSNICYHHYQMHTYVRIYPFPHIYRIWNH